MKLDKAPGPTGVPREMFLAARKKGKKLLVDICNLITTEGRIPSDWKLSTPVPIYKGKSDPLQ